MLKQANILNAKIRLFFGPDKGKQTCPSKEMQHANMPRLFGKSHIVFGPSL